MAKHQKELEEIKAEFYFNKANNIKVVISEDDQRYTKYDNQVREISIINNFNIDDFADEIEIFLKEYIITKHTIFN